MIDLAALHAAGADVAGDHGEAWLRMPAVRDHRPGLLAEVRELHQRIDRRITAADFARHCRGEHLEPDPTPAEPQPSEPPPAQEPPMATDPDLDLINRVTALPIGGRRMLAEDLGVSVNAFYQWKKTGRILPERAEQVRAWLADPTNFPGAPAPQPASSKPSAAPTLPGPLALLRALAEQLGQPVQTAYLIHDGKLIERQVVTL